MLRYRFFWLHSLFFFLLLLLPKALKVSSAMPRLPMARALPLIVPDLLLVPGVEAIVLGLVCLSGPRARPWVGRLLALALVPVALYLASELRFYQAAGSFLDVSTFLHGLNTLDQLIGMVKAEATPAFWAAVVFSTLFAFWLVREGGRAVAPGGSTLGGLLLLAGGGLITLAALAPSYLTVPPKVQPFTQNLLIEQVVLGYQRYMATRQEEDLSHPMPPRVELEATPESKKLNVVIILLESIRASATTPYVPDLASTPFLDRIAKEGVKVEHAYVALPHTTKALVAVLSGYPPDIRRPLTETTDAGLPAEGIARLLGQVGYDSAYFHSAFGSFENNDVLIRQLGFQKYSASDALDKTRWESPNYLGVEDRAMLEPIFSWVDSRSNPFLLTVLTLVSHHDYKIPTTFPARDWGGSERWNSYLNSVHYVDTFVGELFQGFEARGLLDNTLFIFLGDHGEGHGEHERKGHDQILFEEGIRIPMLLYNKTLFPAPMVIEDLRTNIDVLPTVVDLLDLKVKTGAFVGKSLLEPAPSRVIFSSCWIEDQCIGRLWGHEKLIHYYGRQKDEYYNLETDPDERQNRIDTLPTELQHQYVQEALDWKADIRKVYTTQKLLNLKGYVSTVPPNVPNSLNATIKTGLNVLGYQQNGALERGKDASITLWFQVTKNLVGEWRFRATLPNDRDEPRDVKLDQVRPGQGPDSWAPGHYYKVEYSLKIPPRARHGKQLLQVYVDTGGGERREVSGLNTDSSTSSVLVPVRVDGAR